MKKTFLGLCAMALAVVACQQPEGYRVKGVAEGFKEGDTLFFFKVMGDDKPTDTIVVRDGKFVIEGSVDSVTLASVVAPDGSAGALFFTEEGNIDITVSRNSMPKVGGTKANDAWQKVNELQASFSAKFDSLTAPLYLEEYSSEMEEKVMAQYQAVEQEMLSKIIDIAEDNIDNPLGYFVVTSMAGSKELNIDRMKALIGKMPAEYQQRQEVTDILKQLAGAEALLNGNVMPDFTLPTPTGQELSALAEVAKNKVTVIDFWASWCKPCCDEMPNMVSLYEQFKDKGLGIIGVSLDTDKEAWLKGINDMNMKWTQMGDMKGWKSSVAELYQVDAIPYMVVVDQQGTILKKGLRGESLAMFIEEKLQ
ncbi:MAG: AhpC/TSA family protein [Prevotella sp.]|nr:AhpC/TSA family protein [Prevotella sp.]MBR3480163.1 AhpC/TSA family protein [Prevotella sp.]MBR6187393.1 AhpC/TSA family protein [Prevotella sp.]MBR6190464.1 AhpC/TSA family protein [Prevotella sp.]